jgi:hypothetical protein
VVINPFNPFGFGTAEPLRFSLQTRNRELSILWATGNSQNDWLDGGEFDPYGGSGICGRSRRSEWICELRRQRNPNVHGVDASADWGLVLSGRDYDRQSSEEHEPSLKAIRE